MEQRLSRILDPLFEIYIYILGVSTELVHPLNSPDPPEPEPPPPEPTTPTVGGKLPPTEPDPFGSAGGFPPKKPEPPDRP